jgi:integrase
MKLPGSVYPNSWMRGGKRHYAKNFTIEYWRNGRRVKFTTDTGDYERAVAILHEKVAGTLKRKEISTATPETISMNTLFDLVVEINRERELKTANDVIGIFDKHLRPWFGTRRAQSVTSQAIRDYKDHRLNTVRKLKAANKRGATAKATARATINKERAYLKRSFKLGMQEDPPLVTRVPKITFYNVSDNVRTGVLSEANYEKLLALLPPHARIALVISYLTGARKGEVRQIQKNRIDFGAGRIELPGMTTKNGEPRYLPIYREMQPEIERAIAAEKPVVGQFQISQS